MTATTATTTDIAAELGTDPRTLRKFLRDTLGEGKAVVGKGKRYALPTTKKEITALRKAFLAWGETKATEKANRAEAKEAAIDAATEMEIEDMDPTDEEIDALEVEDSEV